MVNSKNETPKSYSIKITEFALQNIDDITGYIAFIKHQPLNAIRVGDRIFQTIERIGTSPHAFRECEEIKTKLKMYRKAVCMSWLIIYKVKATEVTILGIIHGSRISSSIRKLRKTDKS
jgi:plasmid stabilization system protein ParE